MERACWFYINPEIKFKITDNEKTYTTHYMPFEMMQKEVHNIIYGVNLIQSLDLILSLQNIQGIEKQPKTHQKEMIETNPEGRILPMFHVCAHTHKHLGWAVAML